MKRFVIKTSAGVYLGKIEDFHLWTGDENIKKFPPYAAAFESVEQVQSFLYQAYGYGVSKSEAPVVEVDSFLPRHAHVGECVKAGIEPWNFTCMNEKPC